MNRFKHKRACITRENNAHWVDMKSSHLYLYSAFNNTDCVKALHSIKLEDRVSVMYNNNTNLEKFFIQIRAPDCDQMLAFCDQNLRVCD